MIDRFGNQITVGWSEKETLWVEAAVSLTDRAERTQAFQDIADMTGRSFAAVFRKAALMEQARRDKIRRERNERLMAQRSKAWLETAK